MKLSLLQVGFKFGKQLIVFKAIPGREYTGPDMNKHGTERNAEYHTKKIIFHEQGLSGIE